MRPASWRSGSGWERGSSVFGGGGGTRPWLARGGFCRRSPPCCARTGNATSNAKATGKTNRRFIFSSSNRLRRIRFTAYVKVLGARPGPNDATCRGCLVGTVVEIRKRKLENRNQRTARAGANDNRPQEIVWRCWQWVSQKGRVRCRCKCGRGTT